MTKEILYTSPMCGPCHILKNRLKAEGRLDDLELRDISKGAPEHAIRSVPSLITSDGEILMGINPISKHLGVA